MRLDDETTDMLNSLGKDELRAVLNEFNKGPSSIQCGIGREATIVNGRVRLIKPGCQWRTKKGVEAWKNHMQERHPKENI